MQNSLSLMVIQLILFTFLSMIGASLLILIPSMIYRKGRPERPEIRWAAKLCLFLGIVAAVGMFDMYLKNGGKAGLFALLTIAVSVAYWFCLSRWSNHPDVKPRPNPRRVRTHRARVHVTPHR